MKPERRGQIESLYNEALEIEEGQRTSLFSPLRRMFPPRVLRLKRLSRTMPSTADCCAANDLLLPSWPAACLKTGGQIGGQIRLSRCRKRRLATLAHRRSAIRSFT